MAFQLFQSTNPERESKMYAIAALIGGLVSLVAPFIGFLGLACGIRGGIFSRRVKSKKYLAFSIIGAVLSVISLVYFFLNQ